MFLLFLLIKYRLALLGLLIVVYFFFLKQPRSRLSLFYTMLQTFFFLFFLLVFISLIYFFKFVVDTYFIYCLYFLMKYFSPQGMFLCFPY
jgi:hypothetical protein